MVIRRHLPPLGDEPSGKLTLDAFYQGEQWIDRDGITHQIATMDEGHIRNLLPWLERNADRLHSAITISLYGIMGLLNGEMAIDSIDHEICQLEDTPPLRWLHETELYRALAARVGAVVPTYDDEIEWADPRDDWSPGSYEVRPGPPVHESVRHLF